MDSGFFGVFHAQLGNLKLLYGAEMDGVINESKMNPNHILDELKKAEFIELKSANVNSFGW